MKPKQTMKIVIDLVMTVILRSIALACVLMLLLLVGCGQRGESVSDSGSLQSVSGSEPPQSNPSSNSDSLQGSEPPQSSPSSSSGSLQGSFGDSEMNFMRATAIQDVIDYPGFGSYGRLIFPANESYYSGSTLETLSLSWYSNIQPDKTVEIVNYMKEHADGGEVIFYDIYTEAEKQADAAKNDTGLFFFKGTPGEKFAICNAGGGFAYVGAMHDSFPHALELSKKGYNAFALIYRPGAQSGCEDLARAIAFIFDHAKELEVDTANYSLWGGSAGARLSAWLGNDGTQRYGERAYPYPAAVIMQYTGMSGVTGNEPPTYNCVGTNDGIASYRTMQERINRIKANGTDAEIEVFEGLSHGFGIGTGTVAEGWLDNAVAFWERQMK